jgi:O-antigen/teichoic acid export membrane protein
MSTRVLRGVIANLVGQLINVAIQVGSLPLYLHKWSIATYGTWLLISAVPAYLLLGDFGIVSAAGSRMAMLISSDEAEQATVTFQTAIIFVLGISCILAAAIVSGGLVATSLLTNSDEQLGFMLLGLSVLVSLGGNLVEITFRATDRYAYGMTLFHCIRLAEWLGMMLGLFGWGTFTSVAGGGLLARLLATSIALVISKASQKELRWGVRHASRAELGSIVKPGLGMIAFPLSFAFLLQGTTLIIGRALGPSEVAVFGTYRTIARLTIQVAGIYSNALWTEFSRAYGRGGPTALSPIYHRSVTIGLVSAVTIGATLYFAFPSILAAWTHGSIAFTAPLAAAMVIYAVMNSFSLVPRIALLSTNRHGPLSIVVLAISFLTILIAVTSSLHQTSIGMTVLLIASEGATCLATYGFVRAIFAKTRKARLESKSEKL